MITLPGYTIILFAILVSLISAEIDARVLKKKPIYDHTSRSIVRGLIFLSFSILMHYKIPSPNLYLLISLGGMVQASIFWFLFDITLNIRRGLRLFYLGKTAALDKAFKIPFMQLLAKVFCIGVSCASYYSMVEIF